MELLLVVVVVVVAAGYCTSDALSVELDKISQDADPVSVTVKS